MVVLCDLLLRFVKMKPQRLDQLRVFPLFRNQAFKNPFPDQSPVFIVISVGNQQIPFPNYIKLEKKTDKG